jgi:hypothetical protein
MKRLPARILAALLAAAIFMPALALAADKKPNILILWGDDIGWNNQVVITGA